jgi:hypothetical protein
MIVLPPMRSATDRKSAMTQNPPKLFSPTNLARAKKHVKKMLQRIKQAHTGGQMKRCRCLIVEYQQSMDARVLALLEANAALKPSRRLGKKKLESIAAEINPCRKSDEPVIVNIKTKPNGSYRVVMDFDIRQRARQYLVASPLKAIADLHPHQYATRGGTPAAVDRVVANLHEGYGHTCETDIQDCFPSFTGNIDQFLPVMKETVANTILATHLHVTHDTSLYTHFGPGSAGEDDPGDPVEFSKVLSDARRGIPQGSAVSSIVAEMLLAKPLKSLPSDARLVCYADNMLVMAKTAEEAVSMTKALWSALKTHPVGHLKPKLKSQSIPGQPFVFLGHEITQGKTSVSIVPSPENEAKFASRFKDGLAAIGNPAYSTAKRKLVADDLRHYIESWTASFWRCPVMADRKKTCVLQVQKALAYEAGLKKSSTTSYQATLLA